VQASAEQAAHQPAAAEAVHPIQISDSNQFNSNSGGNHQMAPQLVCPITMAN